jgi:hypothetical protein
VSAASAGDVVSAYAQEVALWRQIDEELPLLEKSKRKLARLFAELKPLVLARGGKRTKGEQNQQSWAKSIIERGLTVRTVDDWIAREAAGWPKQWPIKSVSTSDGDEATPTCGDEEPQLAESANCSASDPAASSSGVDVDVDDDTCECVFRLALTVEKKAQLLSALDSLVGFCGSTNRVEALYEAVLYAAVTVGTVEGRDGDNAPVTTSSILPEPSEVIQ